MASEAVKHGNPKEVNQSGMAGPEEAPEESIRGNVG